MSGKLSISHEILLGFKAIRHSKILDTDNLQFILNQKLPGVCDQHCTNLKGSYQCSCDSGYNLKQDNHSCKAINAPDINEPPSLLFASSIDVKLAYLALDQPSKAAKIKGKRF